MKYFVKAPWWLKKMYPKRVWDIDTKEKIVYLTFDDGPHPVATPFVLDELKKYNAKATFFCIGNNVTTYPDIYERILRDGHRTGNHTNNHLNGWKTNDLVYLADVADAAKKIDSSLFRPPYGRLHSSQARKVSMALNNANAKIIMWDILSGDFDTNISKEKCVVNVTRKVRDGSIVVFHDSEKAFPMLGYALPRVLEFLMKEGYRFESIL